MADPIEAHYTPDGDDWTVAVTGRGRTLTGRAPGLIAARDRADQLVEELAPEGRKTVVHLLNGDAVEFTTAYLTARLARTEEPPGPAATTPEEPAEDGPAAPEEDAAPEAGTDDPAPERTDQNNETKPQDGPPADDSVGMTGPIEAVLDQDVPAPTASAEGPHLVRGPTPAPRSESQAAQAAIHPVPAPTETAPSGS